jgi:Zn-dependent metalloprotease
VVVNQVAMGGNAYFAMLPGGKGELGIGTKDRTIGFRQSPAHSPSILFHEIVHGMMFSELGTLPRALTPYTTDREFGAVSESVADVISTGVLKTDWQNGQEIRGGDPLRDLTDPSIPKWTPAVRKDLGIEEHSLSGILSRAATIAADEVGKGGTSAVVDAWYAAMDRYFRDELLHVKRRGSARAMGAWVRATMRGAEAVAGRDSDLVRAMRTGWERVGLGAHAGAAELRRGAPPANPR